MIHETLLAGFRAEGYTTGLDRVDRSAGAAAVDRRQRGARGPFLHRAGGSPRQLDLRPDIPFGMPFAAERTSQPLPLEPGDRLVLFTDGIIEAQPDGGEMFGLDALSQLLESTRDRSPREAARMITQTGPSSTGPRICRTTPRS